MGKGRLLNLTSDWKTENEEVLPFFVKSHNAKQDGSLLKKSILQSLGLF